MELALLSHLFTIAIKKWRLGLIYNPVSNIRKPAPGKGRDRRLGADEEKALLRACDRHSNPMLGWIVRVALYTGMRAGEIKGLTRLLPCCRGRPNHQRCGRRVTQTIRRAARRHRFVIVDQAAVEDARLSGAARGLLAYLLSRPDDRKVLVNDLKKRGNLGRDGIYALLRELCSAGYVCLDRHRDAQGRMRGGTYIVSEIPAPHPDVPHEVGPEKAIPRLVQPGALPNTDGDPRTTTTNKTTDTNRGTGKHCSFPNRCRTRSVRLRSTSLSNWIRPMPSSSSTSGRARWRPG
jgi:hypothetical protein